MKKSNKTLSGNDLGGEMGAFAGYRGRAAEPSFCPLKAVIPSKEGRNGAAVFSRKGVGERRPPSLTLHNCSISNKVRRPALPRPWSAAAGQGTPVRPVRRGCRVRRRVLLASNGPSGGLQTLRHAEKGRKGGTEGCLKPSGRGFQAFRYAYEGRSASKYAYNTKGIADLWK